MEDEIELAEWMVELEGARLEADLKWWCERVVEHGDCTEDCDGHEYYRYEREQARKALVAFQAKYEWVLPEDDHDVLTELAEGDWFV